MEVINLLSQADRQLGRLDMYSEYIPNIDLFISMHIAKEATQSSKIEGTNTNVEELFLEREEISQETRCFSALPTVAMAGARGSTKKC